MKFTTLGNKLTFEHPWLYPTYIAIMWSGYSLRLLYYYPLQTSSYSITHLTAIRRHFCGMFKIFILFSSFNLKFPSFLSSFFLLLSFSLQELVVHHHNPYSIIPHMYRAIWIWNKSERKKRNSWRLNCFFFSFQSARISYFLPWNSLSYFFSTFSCVQMCANNFVRIYEIYYIHMFHKLWVRFRTYNE